MLVMLVNLGDGLRYNDSTTNTAELELAQISENAACEQQASRPVTWHVTCVYNAPRHYVTGLQRQRVALS